MKPGQIQVFDGLRLTTQHLEHLQGAFHSAVQDIRQILGLGQVHHGFDVVQDSGRTVTVMPGVAFDFQKNRLVCDEPRTLEVKFGEGEALQFVCVTYDQVEDGLVDGHPTLIWDSCAIRMRPTLPTMAENEIPLCALIPTQAGEFILVSLPELAALPEEEGQEADEPAQANEPALPPPDQLPATPQPVVPENPAANQALPESEAAPETPGPESTAGLTVPPSLVTALPAAPSRYPAELPVAQGVLRLTVETGDHLRAMLLESLPQMRTGGDASPGEGEFRLTLASEGLPLKFPPLSLSCQTILRGSFINNPGDSTGSSLNFQATSQGEATFNPELVVQHAVSTIQKLCAADQAAPFWTVDLTEAGIAYLPFNFMGAPDTCPEVLSFLSHFSLLITLEQRENQECLAVNKLIWQGQPSPELMETIRNVPFQFSWQALIAWKAMGFR